MSELTPEQKKKNDDYLERANYFIAEQKKLLERTGLKIGTKLNIKDSGITPIVMYLPTKEGTLAETEAQYKEDQAKDTKK